MNEEEYLDKRKNIDSIFMHYRERAGNTVSSIVIISATLIGIFVSTNSLNLGAPLNNIVYFICVIPIFVSILLGVIAKYLYFLGYKNYARSEFENLEAENQVREENMQKRYEDRAKFFKKSNDNFNKADKFTTCCWVAFLIWLPAIFIIYSLDYFIN